MRPALHIEIEGSGPPLVLVNGAGCTVRQWDRVVDALAAEWTVVRHDVRGLGRSAPGPADDYRFEQYADDIIEFCGEAGFERFDLWGTAWGARVALVTAARYPAVVNRLVLTDLAIDPADPAAQRDGAIAAKEARAAAGLEEVDKPVGVFDHDHPEEAQLALAATRLHPDLMPFVTEVRAPTLIATGVFDPNLESSRRALAGFADASLVVFELTAHGSLLQRPDLVLATATDFLRQ